jgi:hypothetical protein
LGNESGTSLAESVFRVTPDVPPTLAVSLRLAQRVPEPTVKITAEHSDTIGDARYLLVVPRKNRRSLQMIDQVPAWFETFGVDVLETEFPETLTDEISCWFDDPKRHMYAFKMRGGEDNAAWQLAITAYVAEHWDVHARGLDTLHLTVSQTSDKTGPQTNSGRFAEPRRSPEHGMAIFQMDAPRAVPGDGGR